MSERTEFQTFWRDIEARKVQDRTISTYEEAPDPTEENVQERKSAPYQEAARQAEEEADRLEAIAARELPEMDFLSRDATAQWRQLEENLNKQLVRDGYAPRAPADFETLARDMAQFRETLAKLRAQEMQRALDEERGRPVPGPHGRASPVDAQSEAETRMLDDMERPSGPLHDSLADVTPEERLKAEEAMIREVEAAGSRDEQSSFHKPEPNDRLAWLRQPSPSSRPEEPAPDEPPDRMDWLKKAIARNPSPDDEPEQEPERDRERW